MNLPTIDALVIRDRFELAALRRRLLICAALSAPVVTLAMVPSLQFRYWQWLSLSLAGPVIVWGAAPFHASAWSQLRRSEVGLASLISLGTLAAFGWSLFTLFLGKAGVPGLRHGFDFRPQPGMGISHVYLEAAVTITVLALAGRYLEAKAMMDAGHIARQSHVPRLQDRVAAVLVPGVIVLAVFTFGYWIAALGSPAIPLAAAVAVLVVAAPCAIGLAAPSAFAAASRQGNELGIALGEPQAVERAQQVDTLLFDTGALRTGQSDLAAVTSTSATTDEEALRLAGSLAVASAHPLALVVADAARRHGIVLHDVEVVIRHPGLALSGVVDGHSVVVGRQSFLANRGLGLPSTLAAATAEAEASGYTTVLVGWDGVAQAVLTVADTVHGSSIRAVTELHQLGLRCVLCTGDDQHSADSLGEQVGVDEVIAELDAEGRIGLIRTLRAEGHVVALLDDEPDAAKPDLGITAGTSNDLWAAADAIRLARRTQRIAKQNLFWALCYNLVALPIAAGGLLTPMIAAAAMTLSTVFVILNSMRLLRFTGSGVAPEVQATAEPIGRLVPAVRTTA